MDNLAIHAARFSVCCRFERVIEIAWQAQRKWNGL
jgi:hypothetical protein